MRNEKFIRWGYITGQEILFDDNVILKIISYDSKSQKVYFKYNNEISCCQSSHFIEFDSQRIENYFEILKYKYEIGECIIDEGRNLLIIDRFLYNKKKLYKAKCNICGYTCVVDEYSLKEHEYSCRCCYGNVVIQGINDIPTIDSWMVDYFQGGYDEAKLYTRGSNAKIYFKCPFCNRVQDKATPIFQLAKSHRLNCLCMDSVSYPEKFMRNFLQINDINYMYHVGNSTFNWCKRYIYDFYIPNKNIIIETHGEQHYTHTFRKSISLEEQKKIDLEKETLAKNNGFLYIIIDCRKSNANFIFNNIKDSGLIELLNIDINNIDLNKIEAECQKNITKEVCDMYNSCEITTKQLSEKYKFNISTINKYLHKGNELGWCNYNPELNLKNGQAKTKEIMTNRRKKIYGNIVVFDENDNLIGEYVSQYEASRELNKIGIKISVSSIGQALKRSNHKSKNLYFYYKNEIKEMMLNESSN